MSSKRGAENQLNHENWNDDDEAIEAGNFRKADEGELDKRVRKVAKRRIGSLPQANPFGGFGGFGSLTSATTTSTTNSSPFNFLSKLSSTTNGSKTEKTETTPVVTSKSSSSNNNNNTEYLSKVKALNTAFLDWIKTSLIETPVCNLSPVFKDYEKYLTEFEALKASGDEQKSEENKKPEEKASEPINDTNLFSFGKPAAPPVTTTSSQFSSFKFGGGDLKSASTSPTEKSFSFGITAQSSTINSTQVKPTIPTFGGFGTGSTPSFGSGTTPAFGSGTTPAFGSGTTPAFGSGAIGSSPFSFGNVGQSKPAETAAQNTEADADDEPPKNDFVPVVEDESIFSKRCKVFVKGASDYSDRGVGTLYLKKVEDTNKVQLIVRADTNLGNILLNVMVVEGLPVSRTGKNNVLIVCIPTPDSKPPPTSVLLRVKTSEEADELLQMINKQK
ncbi:unnamed protein product [Diamesa serratosioi]